MVMLTDENTRKKWLDALRQHELRRSTVPKAFVEVLSEAESPLSADEIREAVQRIRPETGRATVYRYVEKLTALGLLQRVHGYRNCNTYIPSLVSHQAVLVCTECGKVSELGPHFQSLVFSAIETATRDLSGHHITACHLQLLGICIACQSDQT